ncbi:hypothetical protein [Pseudomonas akapageensis]|uniref:hypothetical protein n=1 Tax=Pseudomonas akapageensis TaxID=2609961 RepID=UPI00140E865E|nr:hypothetical protein [Pseudomonas akapageensis]
MSSKDNSTKAAGDFDPGFNSGSFQVFTESDWVQAICPAPGGKTIVTATDRSLQKFWIARLNADGTRDEAFGMKSDSFAGKPRLINPTLLALPEGKFMLADDWGPRIDLARYLEDGSPDLSFGIEGKFTIQVDTASDQTDESIMSSGGGLSSAFTPDGRFLMHAGNKIIRVTASGELDKSFASNGFLTVQPDTSESFVQGIAVLRAPNNEPGYRIIVAIAARNNTSYVGSFDQNGKLDADFATQGYYQLKGSEHQTILRALTITPADEIVAVGGEFHREGFYRLYGWVIKLDRKGKIPLTFNNGTPLEVRGDFDCELTHVEVGLDHLIMAGGVGYVGESYGSARFRFKPTGELDTLYGGQGYIIDTKNHGVRGMFYQSDKLVVGSGYKHPELQGGIIARYL